METLGSCSKNSLIKAYRSAKAPAQPGSHFPDRYYHYTAFAIALEVTMLRDTQANMMLPNTLKPLSIKYNLRIAMAP